MKRTGIFSNKFTRYFLMLMAGIFLGWLFFHPGNTEDHNEHLTDSQSNTNVKSEIWTCAMHPQIRMDEAGKCPICGMDLIPLSKSGGSSVDPDAVHLGKEAVELANVLTTVVSRQKPVKEIRLYGKIRADERLLKSLVAHVPGRIERLGITFTGETVEKGQVLAEIYSPELVTAQQELLETVKTKKIQPELYEASKEKLRQWKLSDEQIADIESSGEIINDFQVLSNTSGTVTARKVNTGDHVSEGSILFEIADLSRIWILFDAYESDLQFINKDDKISFTLQSLPGSKFTGTISFIDPVIDPVTRVAKVRVETDNRSGKLKPEMFATGILSSDLDEYRNSIVIPGSAVLWTGKRSIVYVKEPGNESIFRMREVELGPSLGESYVVINGLSEGEEIVTSGTFSVDASAQLEGKPSMMNPAPNPSTSRIEGLKNESSPEITINTEFKSNMNVVFENYILLKNAFVESNPDKAIKNSQQLAGALKKADMNLLSGDAQTKWIEIFREINKDLSAISASDQLEDQLVAFSGLSDQLYKAIKIFGLINKTAYYQYCPMAFDNKGAYWLSEINEIRNPYFGNQMLTCGETLETLGF